MVGCYVVIVLPFLGGGVEGCRAIHAIYARSLSEQLVFTLSEESEEREKVLVRAAVLSVIYT